MAEEMIVFTRCYDLLAWLMPKAEKFPHRMEFAIHCRDISWQKNREPLRGKDNSKSQ